MREKTQGWAVEEILTVFVRKASAKLSCFKMAHIFSEIAGRKALRASIGAALVTMWDGGAAPSPMRPRDAAKLQRPKFGWPTIMAGHIWMRYWLRG